MSAPPRDQNPSSAAQSSRYGGPAFNQPILQYVAAPRPDYADSFQTGSYMSSLMDDDNQWSHTAFPNRRRMLSGESYGHVANTEYPINLYEPPTKKARTDAPLARVESEPVAEPENGKSRGSSAKGRGKSKGKNNDEDDEGSKAETEYPSVLTREKKQKACSNCRKAKLKCIMDDGETDCVRCKSRKEKCIFYPRTQVYSHRYVL
jgi:hypothetical protein